MTEDSCESIPVQVPRQAGAKQVGEVRVRWAWVERTVWTDRMLTALERGVKGGVWFSLIDSRTPTLPSRGCTAWKQPLFGSVNPWRGEPPTGEPDAGEPHVRFGGRGDRVNNRPSLPLSWGMKFFNKSDNF